MTTLIKAKLKKSDGQINCTKDITDFMSVRVKVYLVLWFRSQSIECKIPCVVDHVFSKRMDLFSVNLLMLFCVLLLVKEVNRITKI